MRLYSRLLGRHEHGKGFYYTDEGIDIANHHAMMRNKDVGATIVGLAWRYNPNSPYVLRVV